MGRLDIVRSLLDHGSDVDEMYYKRHVTASHGVSYNSRVQVQLKQARILRGEHAFQPDYGNELGHALDECIEGFRLALETMLVNPTTSAWWLKICCWVNSGEAACLVC